MSRQSPFPPFNLEDALILAQTIFQQNSGREMRRVTIFDHLARKPDSGPSRQLK